MSLYLIIMGVQGAGKGVQAQVLADHYDIPHVSTGDLFRAMKTRQDPLAQRIQEIMSSGLLVDDDTTNEVVRDRLEQPDAANGVILDGFPRNQKQAEWLGAYLASQGKSLTGVLLLDLDLYTAFKRAFGRVTAPNGDSYNIFYNNDAIEWSFVEDPNKAYPPALNASIKATGEKLLRRADDADAGAIIKRIDVYVHSTQPLIDFYRAKGLVVEINADQSIEAVSKDLVVAIDASKQG